MDSGDFLTDPSWDHHLSLTIIIAVGPKIEILPVKCKQIALGK